MGIEYYSQEFEIIVFVTICLKLIGDHVLSPIHVNSLTCFVIISGLEGVVDRVLVQILNLDPSIHYDSQDSEDRDDAPAKRPV